MKAYLKKKQRVEALSSNAHVSQRKFCAMKPAASLARAHVPYAGKKNKLRIVEERIAMHRRIVFFFLPPLMIIWCCCFHAECFDYLHAQHTVFCFCSHFVYFVYVGGAWTQTCIIGHQRWQLGGWEAVSEHANSWVSHGEGWTWKKTQFRGPS